MCKVRRRYRGEQEGRYNGKEVALETATQKGRASVYNERQARW
jgi:hypothetical protein